MQELFSNKLLLAMILLTLAVIFVNGWTDAPNAIATCVATRSMSPGQAVLMAAFFNFLGVFVMSALNAQVAQTIYNMVDFGGDSKAALIALCAALLGIVLWASAAWWFGIPTSESHALIAGVSGAAIALQGGVSGINADEWVKVIYGLLLSVIMGFLMGGLIAKLVERCCFGCDRRKTAGLFQGAQIVGGALMAFMHGAQDGQKFLGIFMLGLSLAEGNTQQEMFEIPVPLMVLCSLIMALGTSMGGRRIIKSVGMDMVRLEKYQGFSADLAGAASLLTASLLGLPISTTHTKTSAIMGASAARRISTVNWGIVRNMAAAWLLTFPGCGFAGFVTAHIFMQLFL